MGELAPPSDVDDEIEDIIEEDFGKINETFQNEEIDEQLQEIIAENFDNLEEE